MKQTTYEDYPNTQVILQNPFQTDDFVQKNQKLVYAVLHTFCPKILNTYEAEDYIQVGLIALYRAMRTYDKSSNIKFSTYAYKVITNAILNKKKSDASKISQIHNHVYSLNIKINDEDHGDVIEYLPSAENIEDESLGNYNLELLMRNLQHKIYPLLSANETSVLNYMLEDKGYNYSDIARMMGISRERVRQLADNIKYVIKNSNILN